MRTENNKNSMFFVCNLRGFFITLGSGKYKVNEHADLIMDTKVVGVASYSFANHSKVIIPFYLSNILPPWCTAVTISHILKQCLLYSFSIV